MQVTSVTDPHTINEDPQNLDNADSDPSQGCIYSNRLISFPPPSNFVPQLLLVLAPLYITRRYAPAV